MVWPTAIRREKEARLKTDLGSDYDYVLLTNIFHHFDKPTCEILMKRVHGALKPGGKAITLEFVPDEGRVSPPTAAAFSLIMLVNTHDGDAYTFAEYNSDVWKCRICKDNGACRGGKPGDGTGFGESGMRREESTAETE